MTATGTAQAYQPGTLYHVAPGDLLLERNIREATPSAELVASVSHVGVLEPVTAVLNDDGNLVVRYGHRRVMAAMTACVTPIPVYVAGVDDLDTQAEVDRIISQRDENTHRVGLTASDEVGIVEQLAAFGLTADQIASQARVKKEKVETALVVSKSKMAKEHTRVHTDLTLEYAAAMVTPVASSLAIAAAFLAATKELDRLVHAVTGKPVTLAQHKKCPGHVAWIGYDDKATFGCTAVAKNGHRDKWGSSSSTPAAAMTDEEREAAKAERRLVIENNKAWDSAQTVRRDWLATFAKSKTPPKGTAAFIARAIGVDSGILTSVGGDKYAALWLGTKEGTYGTSPSADLANGAPEGRALQVLLVMVLSAYEENTVRMDWRRDGKSSSTGRYLRFLDDAGYGLSDVEKFAVSGRTT